jgi:hypothetical protein
MSMHQPTGCDSAKTKTWLHKAALARTSANGGNVRQIFLD